MNVDNKKLILNVQDYYNKKYGNKIKWFKNEVSLEKITSLYFLGTKTLKFIQDKKKGKVELDWGK
tara:strand:+ start:505 stop:699 length:195 start_codon:yes stop_codon:yes gene_type:complete